MNKTRLRELYGNPSGRAANKVLNSLEKHSIHFINICPFITLATVSKDGKMDVSPRGGNPGFIHVWNDQTIILPDAKGNNRLDSLENILETGTVGMLFMIPGVDETLRINGRAEISDDPQYLDLFNDERLPPKTCIVISIQEIFMHCAKAFMRSKLWSSKAAITRSEFPTMGQILKDQLNTPDEPESREDMIKRYRKDI